MIKILSILLIGLAILQLANSAQFGQSIKMQEHHPQHHHYHHSNSYKTKNDVQPINMASVSQKLSKTASKKFIAEVYLQGNTKPFKMIVDTTSSVSWVYGKKQVKDASNFYECQDEVDCKLDTEIDADIAKYTSHGACADKKVTKTGRGVQVNLTIRNGGKNLLVKDFKFYLVDTITPALSKHFKADGVLGLLPSGSTKTNFLKQLKLQNSIKEQLFTLYYNDVESYLNIGTTQDYFNGGNQKSYDIVDLNKNWGVKLTKLVAAGGETQDDIELETTGTAVFDTTFDGVMVSKAHEAKLKDFPYTSLEIELQDADNKKNKYVVDISEVSFCNSQKLILGSSFMKKYYTVFNKDQEQIKISDAFNVEFQSIKQNELGRWLVFGLGILVVLIGIFGILAITNKKAQIESPDQSSRGSSGPRSYKSH